MRFIRLLATEVNGIVGYTRIVKNEELKNGIRIIIVITNGGK